MPDPRFYENVGPFSLEKILQISEISPLDVLNFRKEVLIKDVASLEQASSGDISFCVGEKNLKDLKSTSEVFCFSPLSLKEALPETIVPLYTPFPQRVFAHVAHAFYPNARVLPTQNFEEFQSIQGAFVHSSVRLPKNVTLGIGAVIQAHAEIGEAVRIGSHAVIGKGVVLGDETHIAPHATLFFACLGKRVKVGPGTRIGQEGFGFMMDEKGSVPVPHLGRVMIQDSVEIGSNCTVDRGSLKDTEIGAFTRIDNLVHIAHNVSLGKGCIIVAQVGIAGSTTLGDYVAAGGQAGLTEHLHIGARARIAAQSGVMRDIKEGETVSGSPALPIMEWRKQAVILSRLTKKR